MLKNDTSGNVPTSNRGGGDPLTPRRFKTSGNPKGRPKGSRNCKTIVREVANEMHPGIENGKPCRRSTLDIVLTQLRNKALAENIRAFEELHRLATVLQPSATDGARGVLVAPAPMTVAEAFAEGEKANAEARARREAKARGQNPES